MAIRRATAADLTQVAAIHKSRFTMHFLGQFPAALLREYYATFLGRSVFFVHEGLEGIDGFVLGGDAGEIAACLRAFVRGHLAACFWRALRRPQLFGAALRRAARTLFRRGRNQAPEAPPTTLLSIAVTEEAVGKGVAAALVRGFEDAIRPRAGLYGLSVLKGNARGMAFYRKVGFRVRCQIGSTVYLEKSLAEAGSPEVTTGPRFADEERRKAG
jgi:ribosomal protein S18 acetylase RimI-like enzyme